MLDILNSLFLVGTIASQAINIVGLAESDIKAQEGVRVYSISMKQQAPLWVEKCHYQGVMVQYARDWEENQPVTGMALAPEPDTPIGYALILTKEKCPGKDERAIFSVGSKYFYPFNKSYVIREGHRMDAVDYASQREDVRPKWMPQVLRTIETDAPRNVAAQNFMVEMKARTETVRATEPAQPRSAASAPDAANETSLPNQQHINE
ncbi:MULTISPECIES: hypothetical protein [Burkholderia]|uniref:hypothetical protein n=1 Tax=Burkholderia TaxID=32008 RepID=UPI001177D00D|nr:MULTISPECIES: hypothetical protein [Burkholderia]MBY4727396.1 hypothetical protein [Burkholderia contaminans]MCI3973118.1 hypothetical protein [Burkholderia sp. HI4860]MDN7792728.1 hypothetical protein [Burkholderia contaminans]